MISMRTIIVAAPEQVAADIAGEVAIINLNSGMYYGLNAMGARIWALIQEPRKVDEIRTVIVKEYEVEPERCERDIVSLLEELAAAGLIEVKDASAL